MQYTLRFVGACVTALCLASAAPAQDLDLPGPVEVLTATATQTPAQVTRLLQATLPASVQRFEQGGMTIFNYRGNDAPPALLRYLQTALTDLDVKPFAPPNEVSISLAIAPAQQGSGTVVQVMVSSDALARPEVAALALGDDLPPGAQILVNEGTGGCTGQMILRQSGAASDIADLYRARLASNGFDVTDGSDDAPVPGTSFFIGYQPGCSVFLYIQEEQAARDGSTVILRYLED